MALTPAQEAAIHARNRELLVSAAAGSGKTRVLVERIFTLVRDAGLSMDRMLIVTFTHAAAAEMRERLQASFADASLSDSRMRRQAELLETVQISTLHSFCLKLVRAYFQEVDIDPLASLGDEVLCANLRAQAKADAMDGLYEQAAAGDAQALALTGAFEDQQIDRMLESLYPFLMALPEPFEWLQTVADKTYTLADMEHGELADTLRMDCALLAEGASELAARNEALAATPLCPEKYRASIHRDAVAVETLRASVTSGLRDASAAAHAFALERLPVVRDLAGEEAALRDQYKANREQIKKLASVISSRLPDDPETAMQRLNAMQPALCGLAKLARALDDRYAALKRERAIMDFNDLERMSLRILQNPAIRAEVAAQFDGVFVDEYQDISGVQEAILNAVKRDVSRETSLPPQLFFYVGDVKQSIYRFRQADPTLFMEKARTFSTAEDAVCRRISLNANFRSRETVLASVNRIFTHVMRPDVTEIDYDAEARLYPGQPSLNDPPTSLHLFTQPVKAADRVKLQAYAIGREIRHRVGQPLTNRDGDAVGTLHYRDIVILGSKMKDVAGVLERTLSEMGIPVYSEDRGAAMESEEIAQALNHLRLMDNIADDLALIACLRSPAIGMDERELAEVRLRTPEGSFLSAVRAAAQGQDALSVWCGRALAELAQERFLLTETPLDAYLWGWLNRSGLYAFYGCQPNGKLRQANLRMLCEKAGEHVRRRGGELHAFLSSVEAQSGVRGGDSPTVLSPWEDVVRVMTIHKSKGLEFPVVFVMGLEETFSARRGAALAMHPRLGVALPYVNPSARTTGDTLLKAAMDLRAQAEEKAERARLLYVAVTRARDELILMGCGQQLAPEDAATGFARNAGSSAYDVFSANSMLAWVCQCVRAGDTVTECAPEAVTDIPLWEKSAESLFSTQSTEYPQKTDSWNIVFHNQPEELENALRLGKGRQALEEPELRKLRLAALLEEARRNVLQDQRETPDCTVTPGASESLRASADGHAGFIAAAEQAGCAPEAARDPGVAATARDPLTGDAGGAAASFSDAWTPCADAPDPLLPTLRFRHRPFKVGVTALVRAQQENRPVLTPMEEADSGDAAALESEDLKRLPLPLARPRQMSDLPAMPAFLRSPEAQTGLRRGIATHKALALLDFAALRQTLQTGADVRAEVSRQMAGLMERRMLEGEEARLADAETIARFIDSDVGRAAVSAETVHREWCFNLRLPEGDGLIVQGVIDLCFLRDGQWSLVDYKTDRVAHAGELWALYGEQVSLYRRALWSATGIPVADTTLFSLSLGVASSRKQEA